MKYKVANGIKLRLLQELVLDLGDKVRDPNANVNRQPKEIFSPHIDIVVNDVSEPSTLSTSLMTPFDPNLDFEAGLKDKKEQLSGENKENEGLDGVSIG